MVLISEFFLLDEQQVNIGAVVGGTVGGFVLLCIVTLLVIFLVRRRNQNPKDGKFFFINKIYYKLNRDLIFILFNFSDRKTKRVSSF